MVDTFILIHSPLVGPYTWHHTRLELHSRGHKVIVPSLLEILDHKSNFAAAVTETIRAQMQGQVFSGNMYLVMHSAAGAFMAALQEGLPPEMSGYIFVDSRLPQENANLSAQDTRGTVEQRKAMARDGMLPRWSDWFGPEVMKEVLPNERIRAHFLKELRPIPVGLFEEPLQTPNGWPDITSGFVRLSEFYKPLTEQARVYGWPVIEKDVGHLHMLVQPKVVTEMILEMTDQMGC